LLTKLATLQDPQGLDLFYMALKSIEDTISWFGSNDYLPIIFDYKY